LSHTQKEKARERFMQLAALPPSDIPLAEMALWIAAESRPQVDVGYWLGELAALGERIGPHCAAATSDVHRVEILNRVLFQTEGFAGNTENYSDPLNSFLDAVLKTRKGIPITLAIIYLDVARNVGLLSSGVGFPGHFLVKVYADSRELIVDPFFGKILSPDECRNRLKQITGRPVDLTAKMLEPVSTREIIQRVLRNLKLLHVSRKEYEEALACSERILLLSGDDPAELRDRGLIYRELGCAGPALADLERYLAHAPNDPQPLPLNEIIRDLRVRARRVH
jgi:regulator of sirC expression with transglutaminase-like and TPR domain